MTENITGNPSITNLENIKPNVDIDAITAKEGDTLAGGKTIDRILSQSSNYIIYTIKGEFGFTYKYRIGDAVIREKVRKFEAVLGEYRRIHELRAI